MEVRENQVEEVINYIGVMCMPNVNCSVCGEPFVVPQYRINRLKNNKICCSTKCVGELKKKLYLGSNNPNFNHDRDLSMFYDLDHDGAYVLGMLWGDGHLKEGSIELYQHESYGNNLNNIAERIFGDSSSVGRREDGLLILRIHDKELVRFIVSLGGISVGKKSHKISLPNIPERFIWSFICGYFDSDGGFKYNYKYPEISISSNSDVILEDIANKYWKVGYTGNKKIYASGYKALDICGRMYENVSFKNSFKYEYFLDILNWSPMYGGRWVKDEFFKCKKLDERAILPSKTRVTDSGYDIYAVDFYEDAKSGLYIADTRIAIEPIPGYYFDLVGRSSLPLNGYLFALGLGVIDRSYVGSLKLYLTKIKEDAGIPELPFKCAQLVPRPIIHANFEFVNELSDTERGSGGFGSTGK